MSGLRLEFLCDPIERMVHIGEFESEEAFCGVEMEGFEKQEVWLFHKPKAAWCKTCKEELSKLGPLTIVEKGTDKKQVVDLQEAKKASMH